MGKRKDQVREGLQSHLCSCAILSLQVTHCTHEGTDPLYITQQEARGPSAQKPSAAVVNGVPLTTPYQLPALGDFLKPGSVLPPNKWELT